MHYAKVVRGPPVREQPKGAAAFLASHVERPGNKQLRPGHAHLALRYWKPGEHGGRLWLVGARKDAGVGVEGCSK